MRTDLISLKAQESSKIKKTQEENLKKLLDIKNQHIREKKEQVSLVKVAQSTSRKKIEYYWEQKKKYHSELRAQETLENEKIKENLEKNLNSLEKLELNLLNRLEKTQDVQTRLYDKFEEAFLLSPSEFSEKQKLKKSQINNKANVRKIEGDLEILNENKKN